MSETKNAMPDCYPGKGVFPTTLDVQQQVDDVDCRLSRVEARQESMISQLTAASKLLLAISEKLIKEEDNANRIK